MKRALLCICLITLMGFIYADANAQYKDTLTIAGSTEYKEIPYLKDGLKQQNLDLYLPDSAGKKPFPLIIWIHGGAWSGGYKGWIEVPYLIKQGYAIASVEYRFSQVAPFPAQIKDCNEAIYYLWKNAKKYGLDTSRFVVGGGSAGGHLASLIGTSSNNHISEFYNDIKKENKVRIRAVLDYYGISDLNAAHGKATVLDYDSDNSFLTKFLGANGLDRPDLAKIASPVTYIDKGDPPFLIIHGDMDAFVPFWESQQFYSWLKLAGVQAQLIKIVGANHAGVQFSAPDIQQKVITFLDAVLNK
jgi:acetyl esterase/lipase